jgi:hypothetical protein
MPVLMFVPQARLSPLIMTAEVYFYFTIELKENIPAEMKGKFED